MSAKNLVIVESPAKAKTIQKYLGSDYEVRSSYGHIRDLKPHDFSIDIHDHFRPEYVVPDDKQRLVAELRSASKKAEVVWLASDEDREGEAIAWHLFETLGLTPEKSRRIVFHEITRPAITHAITAPRTIDINLVNAQQTRRVLDRIVGFELSPVLWKKIKPSLSAGRVQSVAVRLIVDREREISQFSAVSSFRVSAIFSTADATFRADLSTHFSTESEAEAFLSRCRTAEFEVADIRTKPLTRQPAPPFTTSTLQQEAARKLRFSVSQTMRLAQSLYEAGRITYMRTDSLNLSEIARAAARDEILSSMGEAFWSDNHYKTRSAGAQEAHEAIRPTDMHLRHIEGSAQEQRLYDLIYKRTLASQMAPARLEKTSATISVSTAPEQFVATGEVLKFEGFLRVYRESTDDDADDADTHTLPALAVGDHLSASDITATQRFTQPPARYTEASLVKKLEELGIGRPSTYAPTITVIQNRGYVARGDREGTPRSFRVLTLRDGVVSADTLSEKTGADKGKLIPTDIGTVVNDFLATHFPTIMSYDFTANVEEQFDQVAEGKAEWTSVLDTFYHEFHPQVEDTLAHSDRVRGERQLGIDPASGKPVIVKIGRFGPMAQIGDAASDEKPRFASLLKSQSIETISLAEALDLFRLPREVGQFESLPMVAAVGRFGPYIRHDGKFYSLPKGSDPLTVTANEAVALIQTKRLEDQNKTLKTFPEEPELFILNGRFGPYISFRKQNFKIPKTVTAPEQLTLDEVRALMASQEPSKGSARRAARASKSATASAVKKSSAAPKATASRAKKK